MLNAIYPCLYVIKQCYVTMSYNIAAAYNRPTAKLEPIIST